MTYSANAITPAQVKKIAEGAVPDYLWQYKITRIYDPYAGGIWGTAGSNTVTVTVEMPAIGDDRRPFARVIGNHVKMRGAGYSGLKLIGKSIIDTKVDCSATYMPDNQEWFPGRNNIGADQTLYYEEGAMRAALSPPESQGGVCLELRKHPILSDPGIIMFELPDEFFVIGNLEIPIDGFVVRFIMTLSEPLSDDIEDELIPLESDWYLIENKEKV